MGNLNKVMLMGHLCTEPDVRQYENDYTLAFASLATNEHWKDKDGEKQTHTEWHNLIFKGRLAEIAEEYLTKGSAVFIEGRLRTRKYEDAEGITRYSTQIQVDNLQMLGKKDEVSSTPDAKSQASSKKSKDYKRAKDGDFIIDNTQTKSSEFFDDDVPF